MKSSSFDKLTLKLAKSALSEIREWVADELGHSEGTTQMFMAGSLPQTKDFIKRNINLAVMVGPVACTANIPSKPIRFAASKIKEI